MNARRTPAGLLVLLGSLTSLGPLSISFYLPALPSIAAEFGVTEARAQLTMTATLAGLAVGQLVLGTLSDATGRRLPLLGSLGAYAVVSFAIVAADDVMVLVLLRGLQGFFGCAGIVLSRAVVRDTSSGPWIGRLNARLLLVITLTPLVAPTLGAQVLAVASWRTMFVVLGVVATALVLAVAIALPETLEPGDRRRGGLAVVGRSYRALLRDTRFAPLLVVVGLAMAAYFTYVTASPFVFQDSFGLSSRQFGLLFGAGALMVIVGTQLGGRLFGRAGPERTTVVALAVAAAGSTVMALVAHTSIAAPGRIWPLLAALLVTLTAAGALLSTSQGMALSLPGPDAGSRAALLGAAQFGLGAAATPLSGLLGGTAVAMAWLMAAAFLGAALAFGLAAVRR